MKLALPFEGPVRRDPFSDLFANSMCFCVAIIVNIIGLGISNHKFMIIN